MDNVAGQRAATAMQENNFELVSAIEEMVPKMTAALSGKGLITTDVKSKASIISYTNFERAGILVDCVRSIVRFSPEKMETFIAILRQLHPLKNDCPVAISLEKAIQVKSEDPMPLQVKSEDPMEDSFGLSCFDIRDEFKDKGSGRQQGLYPAEEHLYWRKNVLKVHFMNFSEQHYGQQLLTKEMIIGWMNEWRGGEESSVPKFELVGKRDGSDIRIQFSSNSWSYLGNDAENYPMETMHLNLENGPKKAGNAHHMKKYTVLHETGHALGFYHEHQHPDIGTDIFNKEIVMRDLRVADEFYEVNFGKKAKVNDETKFPFHKHSVMMYRVKESWIKSEFRDKILRNKRMRKYDGFYWPESALTGELPKEDKEGAHNAYKEIFPGEAAARLPVKWPRMDVDGSDDLHSLLNDLRGDMILAVKSDMKWLADELHKKNVSFLNDEQHEEVTEVNLISKDGKARIVVEAVLNKVQQDDKNLEVFVEILKRKPQMFKALLEKLDNLSSQ